MMMFLSSTSPLMLSGMLTILSGSLFVFSMSNLSLSKVIIVQWSFIQIKELNLEFPLLLDKMSLTFLFAVSLIAAQVYFFSSSYMIKEKFSVRFHLLVFSFVLSMYMLILIPHLVFVLIGWDGLGITSYLLVIYFQSAKSFNAGILTALSNRVGDCAILLSIAVSTSSMGWSFGTQSELSFPVSGWGLLIVLAACTKSAQIPFSAWLPAAMAAPTPVSALVHSSTLVTAGVYLMIRFNLLIQTNKSVSVLYLLGTLTMLMAGISALTEMDMKKIVALSTLSQLGVMMTTIGAGWTQLAFFHLILHAFFKALLFITVGFMIHSAADYQDLRQLSLSPLQIPLISSIFLGANFSLCGLPFMSGFFSKDMCIETILSSKSNFILMVLFYLATALTAAYTIRLAYLIFLSSTNKQTFDWVSDSDLMVSYSTFTLFILSCGAGSSVGVQLLDLPLSILLTREMKLITIIVIGTGGVLGAMSSKNTFILKNIMLLNYFYMWSLPQISSQPISSFAMLFSSSQRAIVELSWTEKMISDFPVSINKGTKMSPYYTNNTYYHGLMLFFLSIVIWNLSYNCVNFLTPKSSKLFML